MKNFIAVLLMLAFASSAVAREESQLVRTIGDEAKKTIDAAIGDGGEESSSKVEPLEDKHKHHKHHHKHKKQEERCEKHEEHKKEHHEKHEEHNKHEKHEGHKHHEHKKYDVSDKK